jgi:hypothetical protein
MILLGIFAGLIIKSVLPGLNVWAYTAIRLLILPVLMGLGYEIIRFAGKHPNFITRAISAPGLWVQRITTKEPTLDMLEVAITSLKCSLRDDYPEFKEFFENKGWVKNPEIFADNEELSPVSEETETNKSTEQEAVSDETVAEQTLTVETVTENTECGDRFDSFVITINADGSSFAKGNDD